jgi:hypothetical protein
MRDLDFISGEFFEYEIPKDKRFLLKYYKTDMQLAFLRYYLVFGECRNFVDHTGCHCSPRMVYRLEHRFQFLVNAHSQAKSSFTEESMEFLQLVESGKLVLTKYGIS